MSGPPSNTIYGGLPRKQCLTATLSDMLTYTTLPHLLTIYIEQLYMLNYYVITNYTLQTLRRHKEKKQIKKKYLESINI